MASTRLKSNGPAPLTVRVAVAAEMLGIGRTKIYEMISADEIEVIKLGSATLIVVASLEAFIERQRASVMDDAESLERFPLRLTRLGIPIGASL